MSKRPDPIHPAIQLSLMLGLLGNEDPAMVCLQFHCGEVDLSLQSDSKDWL